MSVGNWYDLEPGPIESEGLDGYLCQTRETWKNSNELETCDEVLEVLRKCQKFIQQFEGMDAATLAGWGYNPSWSGPLMFIHFAPQAFFYPVTPEAPSSTTPICLPWCPIILHQRLPVYRRLGEEDRGRS